ncbi:Coenzyme F420 hydrogenase/dehydrogenase, beta subunit C-terminal domain [Herbiconiux sp. CPCC 205763]|uniref:Coenzyme F420 hydrogenase/dehydrogenase, beta subunit C-terminal domain n=2 Tax=Herbiconiux aconitum TaxID=2970913 RepID=A0ABT2GKL3_9MICO|nr:Coenzyme F420 hydrogenase/dehydrogenase, beta subunit C-terminal domain [Herbiconiux aconitum]
MAPRVEGAEHEIFGRYVSVWEGYARDDTTRFMGSSGGVITAMTEWMLKSEIVNQITGSAAKPTRPTTTVPVTIMTRAEALESAGSRYGPVANLAGWKTGDPRVGLVGKPCEVSAASQLQDALGIDASDRPVLLSFFCAGTPSQFATDALVRQLGVDPGAAVSMKYRGGGWPGTFEVSDGATTGSLSYDESWGKHLGRQLQQRCKICVDGTGAHADIAVGDYWMADENGYPLFEEGAGNSVVIARTQRGHELLQQAALAGAIAIMPLELDRVRPVQPLQVKRKLTLVGRLLGRRLAGKAVPKYAGYGLLRLALRNPANTARAALGTFRRSLRRSADNR